MAVAGVVATLRTRVPPNVVDPDGKRVTVVCALTVWGKAAKISNRGEKPESLRTVVIDGATLAICLAKTKRPLAAYKEAIRASCIDYHRAAESKHVR